MMKKAATILLTILIVSLSTFVFTANVVASDFESLDAVTLISANASSSTSIDLDWTNNSYSYWYDGYKIYRATSKNGTYSLIKKITSPYTTDYTDKTVTVGKTYYYKVCKYMDNKSGKFSNIESATAAPIKMFFSAAANEKDAITLTWNRSEKSVDGYVLYRATSKNGTYKAIKRIKSGTTTSYKDTTITPEKFYYYKMKSFVLVKGKSVYSEESDPVRNKVNVKLCRPYLIKMKNLPSDGYEFDSVIRLKYGNTTLVEGKDYSGYISGWGSTNGVLDHVYYTIYGYSSSDFSGDHEFTVDTIGKKTYLQKVSITNSGMEVSWYQESGAYGYKIYRKTGSGSFTLVKIITDNEVSSWTDKSANKLNKKYTYCVQAYTKNGSKYLYAQKSDALSAKRISTPKLNSVSNTKNGIVLKWRKVKGAKSYDILRKTENGQWKYIANTKNTQYVDKNTRVGSRYTYTVCCSNGLREARTSRYNSKGLNIKRFVAAEGKSLSSNSVKITWNKATGASGYAVYRATSPKGTYKKIATLKGVGSLSYTDKKLTFAKYYYYKVRSYSIKNGKTTYGDYGPVLKIRPTLGTVSIKKAKDTAHTKVKLTWGKLPKASGYQVYMATSKNGTYKKVKTVSGNSTTHCTVTKLENAKTYYFKVRGYIKAKGKTYYGDFSTAKSCFIDVLGYENESYYNKNKRIWGSEYYGGYYSSKEAQKDMTTIRIKTWDINSNGKKYTRYHNLTVHKNIAPTVKQIFKEIYNGKEKFPIKSVGGYSWRGTGSSSQHGAGLAIDINPNENAQFDGDTGKPKVGSFWKPGKNPYSITPNGDVVKAFEKYGFGWGNWFWNPDYMHFSYYGT